MSTQPFTYCRGWGGRLNSKDQNDLIAFWLREGALSDETQAQQRLSQVVVLARDGEGMVAGVCTAAAQTPSGIGQPLYYYRSFIGRRWRRTRLVYHLIKRARTLLEEDARARDWPCIGMLLELENSRFGEKGRMPVWPRLDFTYVGKSPRGLELRVHYFKGARLKN